MNSRLPKVLIVAICIHVMPAHADTAPGAPPPPPAPSAPPPPPGSSAPPAAQAVAPTAPTPVDRALARRHFELGIALAQRGTHEDAIHEFESAYAVAPLPNILYNLGREWHALAKGGNVEAMQQAIGFYRRYLEARPNAPDRPVVAASIAQVEEMAAAVAQTVKTLAGSGANPTTGAGAPSAPEAANVIDEPTKEGAATPGPLADERALAKRHFEVGISLSQRGSHRDAIKEFESAYAAAPLPNILYNLAREHQALARSGSVESMRRSIDYYKRYLAAKPDAHDRAEVQGSIASLDGMLATVEASVAKVLGHPVGAPHAPGVVASGDDDEAQPLSTELESGAAGSGYMSSRAPLPRGRKVLAAVLIPLGVAAIAGGVALVLLGQSAASSASSATTLANWSDQHGTASSETIGGAVLVGVGAAAAVAGVIAIAWPRPVEKTAMWVTPTGNGLALAGTF